VAADDVADGGYLLVAGRAVDRDGEAVTGQAPRDHRPQAPRAAGHQGDTSLRYRHVVMISPPTRQADPAARSQGHHPARDERILSKPRRPVSETNFSLPTWEARTAQRMWALEKRKPSTISG
jgi:hypothetical protein